MYEVLPLWPGPFCPSFSSTLLSHNAGMPRLYRGAIHWAQQGKQLRWKLLSPTAAVLTENTSAFHVLATTTKNRSHIACGHFHQSSPQDCLIVSIRYKSFPPLLALHRKNMPATWSLDYSVRFLILFSVESFCWRLETQQPCNLTWCSTFGPIEGISVVYLSIFVE